MKKYNNNESRSEVRRHLLYYLTVNDLKKNQPIAKLGDINSSGILLVMKSEIKQGKALRLGIIIPESLSLDRTRLDLEAEVKWCREAENPGMYEVGCSFSDINNDDKAFIDILIKRIGFSDGMRKIYLVDEHNVFNDAGEN